MEWSIILRMLFEKFSHKIHINKFDNGGGGEYNIFIFIYNIFLIMKKFFTTFIIALILSSTFFVSTVDARRKSWYFSSYSNYKYRNPYANPYSHNVRWHWRTTTNYSRWYPQTRTQYINNYRRTNPNSYRWDNYSYRWWR